MPHAHPLTSFERLASRLAAQVPVDVDEPGLYWAAVAVILAPGPDSILLIRRAHQEGDPWSGHMALPGGRREAGDPDLVATAMRETREEVAVPLERAALVGALADVIPRTPVLPPIAVRPYLFHLESRPPLSLSAEVAAAEWIPLDVLRASRQERATVEVAGMSRSTPAFVTLHGVVWGMTERILADLLSRLD
ncbi:MAG TPA: CoA pyrophosphatase [Gemmatimonadales bacterium]